MTKKKVVKLTPEQYWKWSNFIAEMWQAKNLEESKKWQSKYLSLQAQLASTQAALFKAQDVKTAERHSVEMEENYKEYKKELEDALGISLNGVTIDEISHEVRQGDE